MFCCLHHATSGRRILTRYYGDNCFTKHWKERPDERGDGCVGAFYLFDETKPYMHVLDALSDKYADMGWYDEAAYVNLRSLMRPTDWWVGPAIK